MNKEKMLTTGQVLYDEIGLKNVDGMMKGGYFSMCRKYRFVLYRTWNEDRSPLNAICLNPSTSTETEDDPTVRRLMDYAKRWGYGGLVLTNLFSYRATNPAELKTIDDPVHNELNLRPYRFFVGTGNILVAWGNGGRYLGRGDDVIQMMIYDDYFPRDNYLPCCLGVTKALQPKHPLYLKKTERMKPYKLMKKRIIEGHEFN